MSDSTAGRPADVTEPPVMGLDYATTPAPRKVVASWALWDWATQPFNSVLVTFVFVGLYLVSDAFIDPSLQGLASDDPTKTAAVASLATGIGAATTIAGLLVLVLAPALGQQADAAGRHKLWLGIGTGGLVVTMLLLWFVEPTPALFWLGVSLIAAGQVLNEIAGVNNNALLFGISTPKTVGRVSGLGWGLGYIGGIVALAVVAAFAAADWFGLPTDDGLPFRIIAVACGVWAIVFSIPLFRFVPEPRTLGTSERVSFFGSYVVLARTVVSLYRSPETRPTFWFLIASAVFRDGLSGIFVFGGVIAGSVFGFSTFELLGFAIAANLVAGVSTIVAGRFDDIFGPKRVIAVSLAVLVVAGLVTFFAVGGGPVVFWVAGLVLCACVGPAQASARSFLARVTPAGREGEIFGLYATTGRAAGWMAGLAWTVLTAVTQSTVFGILGLCLVVLLGLVLLLPIRAPRTDRPEGSNERGVREERG